ncbi:hypothetical protein Rhopal_000692-T1 [Rhodotorula paludigena]|uniref:Core domain-containing protein n=1 Tax=Rhodotorula paludigena TaxID=86838 RepID=A0AAV5GEH6_9BASI|nr:hypothetical protein Rhopal_000692-T1 [Rhodotorula paludigena]
MQRTCTRCSALLRPALSPRPLRLAPSPLDSSASRHLVAPPLSAQRAIHTLAQAPRALAPPARPARLSPRARWAATTPSRRGIACAAQPPANPPEDFEPVEDELKEGEKLEMDLTDKAVKQILKAQAAAKDPSLALRLAVESGGCHGYQYKMQVTSTREPDDYLFTAPSPDDPSRSASLLVDAASLPLVKGSTIDYATELIGSAFRIRDNPQSKDAGCGCGVSWELKDLD